MILKRNIHDLILRGLMLLLQTRLGPSALSGPVRVPMKLLWIPSVGMTRCTNLTGPILLMVQLYYLSAEGGAAVIYALRQ